MDYSVYRCNICGYEFIVNVIVEETRGEPKLCPKCGSELGD